MKKFNCNKLFGTFTLLSALLVSNGAETAAPGRLKARILLSTGEAIKGEMMSYSRTGMLTIKTETETKRVFWPNVVSLGLEGVKPEGESRGGVPLAFGKVLHRHNFINLAAYLFSRALKIDPKLKDEISRFYEDKKLALPKMLGGTSVAGSIVEQKRHYSLPSPRQVAHALSRAKQWGAAAQKLVPSVHLIETEHFLIYSAWEKSDDKALEMIYEKLYNELCKRLKINPRENIWIGKLPVFAFWKQENFMRFSASVIGIHPSIAMRAGGFAGTSRIVNNGHFRFVVLGAAKSVGKTDAEARIRFFEVLVHESTHAFMGRYIREKQLPNWLDEGIAETMAATLVPQSRAVKKLNDFVKTAPTTGASTDAIFDVRNIPMSEYYYGMCQSLVRYLNKKGTRQFIQLIEAIKAGKSDQEAMKEAYGISRKQLVAEWKRVELKLR